MEDKHTIRDNYSDTIRKIQEDFENIDKQIQELQLKIYDLEGQKNALRIARFYEKQRAKDSMGQNK